jgi:ABC-type transport system substrate-binding protein
MEDEINLKDIIDVLIRQRRVVSFFFVLCVAISIINSLVTKPMYETKTQLLIRTSGISNSQMSGLSSMMGINLGGYANPAFDAACTAALAASPDSAGFLDANASVQKLFAEELPAIPLYFHLKIAAARSDFCGLDMDVSSRSALRAIESFDVGQDCPK